jgi:membrane protease YdiL (CAAX protease family)
MIVTGSNFSNPSVIRISQSITAIGAFVVPSLWFCYARRERFKSFFRLTTRFNYSWLLWLLLWIASIPLISLTVKWNAGISLPDSFSAVENWMRATEEAAEKLTNILLSQNSFGNIILNIIVIALIAAVGEELFFRGVVLRLLLELLKNKHVAVWLSAIIFSALHFQFFGFVPRTLLGVMLGYAYVYSGSLIVPMFLHFVNNASAVLLYSSDNPVFNSEAEVPIPVTWIVVSAFATVAVIVAIVKFNKHK